MGQGLSGEPAGRMSAPSGSQPGGRKVLRILFVHVVNTFIFLHVYVHCTCTHVQCMYMYVLLLVSVLLKERTWNITQIDNEQTDKQLLQLVTVREKIFLSII